MDKEEVIVEALKKQLHKDSAEWIEEELKEVGEDNFYYDSSLSSIADLLYDVYHELDTVEEIENKTKIILGRYGDAYLTESEGGYYIFFNS